MQQTDASTYCKATTVTHV